MSSLYKRYDEFGIHQLSVENNGLIIILMEKARGGSKGGQKGQFIPLQNHIREVDKRMMYKYKNTLKCTIS